MPTKLNLVNISSWAVYKNRPLVIAGPCSAESEEQVIQTARELAKNNIDVFRAGLWKPRTRPNSFEGVGNVGLKWLKAVKEETSLPIAIEIANVKHVYEALKYGVDILWIGARTTANPFAVQEIAEALQGVDTTVLIKNPINPDIELWIGAIERINKAGINKIGAIHRGFSTYEKTGYRNIPQWQIPIELKRRIPEIPLICDPSHICGNKEMLFDVSQKAMDLNYDGLIIESHINPESALSDSSQQLKPEELNKLLKKLVLRKVDPPDVNAVNTLEELRRHIDQIDEEVLNILGKRMQIADEIGKYKKANNVTILQSRRWDEIVNSRISEGDMLGLSSEFVLKIFDAIHQESIEHQTRIMNK